MKNMSVWVLVLVFALVGSAIWYEIQYRHAAPGTSSPVRRASMKHAPPKPIDHQNIKPTNDHGQMIG